MIAALSRILVLTRRIAGSFWFLPGSMALLSALAAMALLAVDRAGLTGTLADWGPPFSVGAEGARSLLSTIAGSIITVASLVFSLTLVALTLAAGSIGARLLQRYMNKRTIQLTLGIFVATFVFSLIVQSSVGGDAANSGDTDGVPRLSVFLALLLAIASLFWLIFAFHDLARTIQVDNAVASLSSDLRKALQNHAESDGNDPLPLPPGERPVRFSIAAGCDGYIQLIDYEALVKMAEASNAVVRLERAAGDFVLAEATLLQVEAAADAEGAERLWQDALKAVVFGPQRTEESDITFRIHLLVEIAARALSSGVNDFYTALICIDHLGAALAATLRSDLRSGRFPDGEGYLRVIALPLSFSVLADAALEPIRQSAGALPPVLSRLIDLTRRLAGLAGHRRELAVLRRHLDGLRADLQRIANGQDRARLEAEAGRASIALDEREAALAQAAVSTGAQSS